MPALVSNAEVEDCLRELLAKDGFTLSPKRAHGQTGVDILAQKDDEQYHIEVIAYKQAGPARAKDFYEGFFRVVSRLNGDANHCVLALSKKAEVGLPARAAQHRVAWLRIAKAFPELEIWLVDTERRAYRRRSWREWVEADTA